MAPMKAYLLFEAHPANRSGYRFKLRTASKNITEYSWEIGATRTGDTAQMRSTRKILNMGATKNKARFLLTGTKLSFTKSLTASANGCKSPTNETLLGPLRLCLRPKIFRSNNVKKATLTNTGMMIVTYLRRLRNIIPGVHLCGFSAALSLSYKDLYKWDNNIGSPFQPHYFCAANKWHDGPRIRVSPPERFETRHCYRMRANANRLF